MKRSDVIDNANIRPGDVIVGLASYGQATYEKEYNGGMGSNGLTSARHAGCVIGADGFGFAPTPDGYSKIPQIGIVVLEDDVEIGANTCIDRATMGATIIRKGVKLDNLIQIAHNDEIGSHTVMAAQVGVAGSTKVGEWCMFGGQVGLAGHIKVGDRVGIGAQAGVPGNVASNSNILGTPAFDAKQFFKSSVVYKRLPEVYTTLNNLQKEINELKKQLNK